MREVLRASHAILAQCGNCAPRCRAQNSKIRTRDEIGGARRKKFTAGGNRAAANHSALIRSFFDRFRSARAFCAANCEKYFCLCRCLRSARMSMQNMTRTRKNILPRGDDARDSRRAKSPYFIVLFAISRKCVARCATCALHALSCCACAIVYDAHARHMRADTRFVKRNTVFFIVL